MYNIYSYGGMIADHVRMEAYVRALRQAVKPDSVVLDIGTGTGIFALLACQFGAHHVYAIEPSDAIHVAREIAMANGYAERIDFIQGISTQVALPERADVMISDLRGVLPLYQQHIYSIIDARNRLLASDGILIPKADTLWAAVVEAPDLYNGYTIPWETNGYCLDMRAAQRIVTNSWSKGRVAPEQLLVEPKPWVTLDYGRVESVNVDTKVSWPVARPGTACGLVLWFDAHLADGITFSNAPGSPELVYGTAFFPWFRPVRLAEGDQVYADIQANLIGEDYLWRWATHVLEQGDPTHVKAEFKQSTFFGVPLSADRLRKQEMSYAPTLNEEGQIKKFILTSMDGKASLREIARQVVVRFPTRFTKWQDALTRIGELSVKYSL
jgi:type I protein arginine methyltransferase